MVARISIDACVEALKDHGHSERLGSVKSLETKKQVQEAGVEAGNLKKHPVAACLLSHFSPPAIYDLLPQLLLRQTRRRWKHDLSLLPPPLTPPPQPPTGVKKKSA